MKTRILIAAALATLCLTSTQARIGETENQIEARYGQWIPPLADGSGVLPMKMYRSAGMTIGVAFLDGKSAAEIYTKRDKSVFTDEEIQILLEANSGGAKWIKAEGPSATHENWSRPGAICTYSKYGDAGLMIMSDTYCAAAAEFRKASAEQKLGGF